MINRTCTVMATVTLLTLLSGCSGLRERFSGRGARCGLCSGFSKQAPAQCGAPQQQPCGSTPYAPQAPCNQNSAAAPGNGCGCSTGGVSASPTQCGTCGNAYGAAYGGGCGGGQSASDPYLSGGITSTTPYDGQIIGYGVTGDGVVVGNGTTMSDGFVPRFDSQGNQILNQQPIPASGVPVN